MLTDFGKALRVVRVNRNISAKEMSDTLKISPSYLSAIENGKRSVPDGLLSLLLQSYQLSDLELTQVESAIKSTDNLKLDMAELPEDKRKIVLALTQDKIDKAYVDALYEMIKE